jgi:hypothetical protein
MKMQIENKYEAFTTTLAKVMREYREILAGVPTEDAIELAKLETYEIIEADSYASCGA